MDDQLREVVPQSEAHEQTAIHEGAGYDVAVGIAAAGGYDALKAVGRYAFDTWHTGRNQLDDPPDWVSQGGLSLMSDPDVAWDEPIDFTVD